MAAQFRVMQASFGRNGGLVGSDDIERMLRTKFDQPISILARWIAGRAVVSFNWRAQILLPLFQFDLSVMSIRQEAAAVVLELSDTFDDWDLAAWFATPNLWLQMSAPVDVVLTQQGSVLEAARADRYIAHG